MTPQQQPTHDAAALQELGRASVEVVHDIKNQLNGLKLYATFLRKRAERDQRPTDEVETVNKIIAGLERAAAEMNLLVRFGRTLELRRASQDLSEIVRAAAADDGVMCDAQGGDFRGEFDAELIGEAFREINAVARAHANDQEPVPVSLRREETAGGTFALIEWRGVKGKGARNIFGELDGAGSLHAALAAKIIGAHDGAVEHIADVIRVRIPLHRDEG